MSRLKEAGLTFLIVSMLAALLLSFVNHAVGAKVEVVRETKITDNIKEDFEKAVAEMVKELRSYGCDKIKGMAYTQEAKPGILTVVLRCADAPEEKN